MSSSWIEVHQCQHDVISIFGPLAIGDDVLVVDGMESQPLVGLERGVLAPNCVDLRNQTAEIVRSADVPALQLVLLGVEVLLAPRLGRRMLAQLEGRPVDAVTGAERRGEDEPGDEGCSPALHQVLGQDVGRVWPSVRAKVIAAAAATSAR